MTTAATGADRADFVWHGHPIRSALALDLPRAASGAPLAPLTIAVDGELADPPARPLWRSAYTGFELHADRTGCWLARPDLRIRIQPDAIVLSATPDAIALEYLRTRVLALWLHLIAAPPIHASAVARDGVALAFLGASGAGKSTLCAAMRAHGCTPLADDLLPLAAGVEGVPVYPGHGGLHLWPDSARHLLGDIAQLPRIPAQGEKRRLAAPAQTRAARLRAVLLLRRGPVAAAACVRLSGAEALLTLLAHGQMAGCAERLGLGGMRLQRLGAALAHFPVYAFEYPDKLADLPAACALAASLLRSDCDAVSDDRIKGSRA